MASSQNDYDGCGMLSNESLRIGTEVRDVEVVAWALIHDAMARWVEGDLANSARQLESALSLARLMHLEQAELTIVNTLHVTLDRLSPETSTVPPNSANTAWP